MLVLLQDQVSCTGGLSGEDQSPQVMSSLCQSDRLDWSGEGGGPDPGQPGAVWPHVSGDGAVRGSPLPQDLSVMHPGQGIVLYCTVHIVLYYTVLYYTVLYCTVLYYTILYNNIYIYIYYTIISYNII